MLGIADLDQSKVQNNSLKVVRGVIHQDLDWTPGFGMSIEVGYFEDVELGFGD